MKIIANNSQFEFRKEHTFLNYQNEYRHLNTFFTIFSLRQGHTMQFSYIACLIRAYEIGMF